MDIIPKYRVTHSGYDNNKKSYGPILDAAGCLTPPIFSSLPHISDLQFTFFLMNYILSSSLSECNTLECQCRPPYQIVGGECTLATCGTGGLCSGGAECVQIAGGVSYCACPKGLRPKEDGTCEGECRSTTEVWCKFSNDSVII